MEKKTISAGIIGAGGFIGQEHLERLIHEIGMEIVCEKGTIRLPLPAEPIVRSRLKVDNEIMDNWAERFPKAYDNELQHWINHLRSIEPTAGPGNKDGFAACCIADAMIASQTSEAEIWYDRRRAWFVHRQIPPLGALCWTIPLSWSAAASPAVWIETARPLRRIICPTPAAYMQISVKWQTRSPRVRTVLILSPS